MLNEENESTLKNPIQRDLPLLKADIATFGSNYHFLAWTPKMLI